MPFLISNPLVKYTKQNQVRTLSAPLVEMTIKGPTFTNIKRYPLNTNFIFKSTRASIGMSLFFLFIHFKIIFFWWGLDVVYKSGTPSDPKHYPAAFARGRLVSVLIHNDDMRAS